MEYKVGELVQIKTRDEMLAENHFCAKGSALHKYGGSTCRIQAVGTLYKLKPINIVDNLPRQHERPIEKWEWMGSSLKYPENEITVDIDTMVDILSEA